jgi:hypothetical protein
MEKTYAGFIMSLWCGNRVVMLLRRIAIQYVVVILLIPGQEW